MYYSSKSFKDLALPYKRVEGFLHHVNKQWFQNHHTFCVKTQHHYLEPMFKIWESIYPLFCNNGIPTKQP